MGLQITTKYTLFNIITEFYAAARCWSCDSISEFQCRNCT